MDENNPLDGQPVQPQSDSAPAAPVPQPEVTPAPQAPQSEPAQAAYAPYAAAPQQPTTQPDPAQTAYAPYAAAPQPEPQQTQAPYQAAYQPSSVPPTPPYAGAPAPYGYEPSGPQQKRRWPWFLLGLAVGLVIGLGGCVSCAGIMAATSFDRADTNYATPINPEIDLGERGEGNDRDYNYDYGYGYEDGNGSDNGQNPNGQQGDQPSTAAGTYSLDEIKSVMFPNGVPSNEPAEGAVCKEGIYTVGAKGQIPAGVYFLEGAEDAESNFYVFEGSDTPNYYKVDDSVVYFGNYFTELEEGDLIVFKPGADVTMYPAPATSFEPKSPYNDGCYRVGIDIPAGSYTITSYEPSAAVATADSGAFVMKDLDFDDDSIEESVYVIPGGKQVITVKDGQYLELFAATATPVSQG